MSDIRSRTGVLLPLATFALLGAGRQGAAAIRNYGVATGPDVVEEIALLDGRLEASDDVEAAAQLAVTRAIVAVAAEAEGWASVRSASVDVPPAVLLMGARTSLAAVLHGVAVEYVVGEAALVAQIAAAATRAAGDAEVTVSIFDEGACLASARFADGAVDLAATDADRLARLTATAGDGRDALVGELVSIRVR